MELSDRFWSKVNRRGHSECWNWTGATRNGYGELSDRGRVLYAHRLSWELHHGRYIPKGSLVCHSCDNRACVNPEHLHLGDKTSNAVEMVERGRGRNGNTRGEDTGSAKLTSVQVLEIRRRYADGGISQDALAEDYGVDPTNIGCIVNRKTWRHL